MSGRARFPLESLAKQANAIAGGRRPVRCGFVQLRQAGETVRWKTHTGTFQREVGDGEHFEILIGERVYRELS